MVVLLLNGRVCDLENAGACLRHAVTLKEGGCLHSFVGIATRLGCEIALDLAFTSYQVHPAPFFL